MSHEWWKGFCSSYVLISVGLGVTWGGGIASPATAAAVLPPPRPQAPLPLQPAPTTSPEQAILQPSTNAIATAAPGALPISQATATPLAPEITSTPGQVGNGEIVATPVQVDLSVNENQLSENDAPLLQQAPGTTNILLLGSDAAADNRYARTDSIIVASINPALPSVSMLSFPRDLQVRFPNGKQDRINTVFEYGYINEHPGGGPAYLSLVLRKNYGIKIDHFVRIDFAGFIKAVDTLGGVDVLVECELHDTFPDKSSARGKTDLDVFPGKVTLQGKEALWYARSRWSTTDFDRARRQQKVLRAVFRKARDGNLLQNALNLYGDFRQNVETDLGPTDLPVLIDIAQRLDNLSIKSRVVTWPIVRSFQRSDGASVLIPTDKTIPYIAEALAPPSLNQAQTRPVVEVYNGSSREDMELVAAERLNWEGFQVVGVGRLEGDKFSQTQIINYATVNKGSPISRLTDVFRVTKANIIGQPDPSSAAAARIILGEDYDSCPNTATIAGDVVLQSQGNQVKPTVAP